MRDYNNFKYTYLFGGGAIRGAAHAGALKALEEIGIEPEILAGSSVGSLVAALYAVGYTPNELAEVFLSVNFELFRDIALGFTPKFALSKGEVFLDWLRTLIESKYYGDKYVKGGNKPVTFKDIEKPLVVITTDMKKFCCNEFSTFETPDCEIAMAVRISCCMPGLMRAVTQGDKLLVDGDLMKGKPMWYLSKNLEKSNSRILEIRLEGSFSASDNSPIEYVNGMYSCMTYSETDFIKNIYGQCDNYDYLTIDTGDVVVVDFNYPTEKRQAIIDKGYLQTIKYFKKDILFKKEKLFNIYIELTDNIRNIQSFFLRKKYLALKQSVAELFIYINDYRPFIDAEFVQEISEFQKICYENISLGLLGRAKCKNIELVRAKLNLLISNATLRTKEFDKYIKKFSI